MEKYSMVQLVPEGARTQNAVLLKRLARGRMEQHLLRHSNRVVTLVEQNPVLIT
jgi:hypothetical protein